MLDNINFGKRIALLRKDKGYTQEQLAQILNVTGQAVSKWEKGNALPDTGLLPFLAKALNVSIDSLFTGEGIVLIDGPYDEEYEKPDFYWGLEHSDLAEKIIKVMKDELKSNKTLLDIGSGEGRDAIYFAENGFAVDALEISLPGIEKIKKFSSAKGLSINTIHADMIGYKLTNNYDVIYSMGSLQFLPIEQRHQHFKMYKKSTNSSGYNAHLVFVDKPFIPTAPDWKPNEFYYKSGELASYYYDWEIVYFEEMIIDCSSANLPHKHAVNSIIAKKIC
ncbi:MAG: helix-turn-helix domain-containing protein [Syntrophomonadaceae bacterium]|nr:helix-turn-helix domain-containing protein [Syntrophomonadaceae bacterium]